MHVLLLRGPWPRRAIIAIFALFAGAWLSAGAPAKAGAALTGTFTIRAGSCASGVTGSYFRMILHNGSTSGPFLSNSDSSCSDQTYTLLAAGADGGLVGGSYQPQASPAFDGSGNALTDRITKPVRFYGVDFATATNQVDPQTGSKVGAPQVTADGGKLAADLRAFAVSWNNQQFNQGAPKPDGSMPGNTRAVTGTYDASTGNYTLQWTSQIQGGPFDGFTGFWHLTGRFVRSSAGPATAVSNPPAGSSGGTRSTPAPTAASPGVVGVSGAPDSHPASFAAAPGGAGNTTGSGGPSSGTTSGSDSTSNSQAAGGMSAKHGSSSPRWPWVLVAFFAVGAVGALVSRQARSGRPA
jgi:hypothetical protein